MESRHIILHIGLHKTGSSSFQAVMKEHESDFVAAGIAPYFSPSGKPHSKEISIALLRDGVFNTNDKAAMYDQVRHDIAAFMNERDEPSLLFSSEHYALMRTDAEIERLRGLFTGDNLTFQIVLVMRDRDAWLASYRNQVRQSRTLESTDPRSAHYIADDTWLVDFDALRSLFERHFEMVTVLDYQSDDIVGVMMDAIGVVPSFNTRAYRRNKAIPLPQNRTLLNQIVRGIVGTDHHGPLKIIRRLRERLSR